MADHDRGNTEEILDVYKTPQAVLTDESEERSVYSLRVIAISAFFGILGTQIGDHFMLKYEQERLREQLEDMRRQAKEMPPLEDVEGRVQVDMEP